MLPLSLLKSSQGHGILVELKNGETYNGNLQSIDTWMNLSLRDVVCTSKDGEKFWELPEVYIRGNTVKYLRIPEEIVDVVQEEYQSRREFNNARGRGSRGRGRGRGGRGGGGAGGRGGRGGPGRRG